MDATNATGWRHAGASRLLPLRAALGQERRRRDYPGIEGVRLASEQPAHAPYVIASFRIRGDAPVLVDGRFARVVRRDRQRDLALVIRQQPAQVSESAANIFLDVIDVPDVEAARRLRNELHQSARILRRARPRL